MIQQNILNKIQWSHYSIVKSGSGKKQRTSWAKNSGGGVLVLFVTVLKHVLTDTGAASWESVKQSQYTVLLEETKHH